MGRRRRKRGPRGPKYGTCPICGFKGRLTVHHIYPKSLFGETGEHILLCREDHNMVEREIQRTEKEAIRNGAEPRKNGRVKLSGEVYWNIVFQYIDEEKQIPR